MKVGTSNSEGIKEKDRKQESKKKVGEEGVLREITVKIGLERIDTHKGITVEHCWIVV